MHNINRCYEAFLSLPIMMRSWWILAVVVVPFLIDASVNDVDCDDGCDPSVFCGSMVANGYCGNRQHCVAVKQWFHNAKTGKCEAFNYYGQGGNYNRFTSKELCERTCIGYSKSYKYKNFCQKCPDPAHMEVEFDFDDLLENGFFCNGDDCKCPLGKKCCPVFYSVTDSPSVEEVNGYTCVPAVLGECEKPEESCSEPKKSHSSKGSYGHSTSKGSKSSARRSAKSSTRRSYKSSTRRSSKSPTRRSGSLTKGSYKISTQRKH